MTRRKYTIEANAKTLVKFATVVSQHKTDAFIQKMNTNVHEEYYYVTVIGSPEVHDALKKAGFNNSQLVL